MNSPQTSQLLSLAIWLPILGALPLLLLGSQRRDAVRWLALLVAVMGFLVTLPLFIGFVEAGIPLGVTFSFLIAAPLVNEVALVMLVGLFCC